MDVKLRQGHDSCPITVQCRSGHQRSILRAESVGPLGQLVPQVRAGSARHWQPPVLSRHERSQSASQIAGHGLLTVPTSADNGACYWVRIPPISPSPRAGLLSLTVAMVGTRGVGLDTVFVNTNPRARGLRGDLRRLWAEGQTAVRPARRQGSCLLRLHAQRLNVNGQLA
jgi:hypothetical protein